MAERTGGISVIINERSGAAARPDAGTEIQTLFARAGVQARLERVREPGDIAARARQAASRGDVLVAAGGDGTVGAVAGVAVETNATFGVLPMGTLNHFAKDIGLPPDLEGAVTVIVAGQVRQLDVGDVNGRIFVNNSSVGLYPRMVLERKAEERRGHGKWTAFAIAMLRTWRNYRMVVARLGVDGKEVVVRTPFIFVGNNQYRAEGFQLGGRSRLDEGRLSIFASPDAGRFEILALPMRALTNQLSTAIPFLAFQTDMVAVDVFRRRASVALDGEVAIMQAPLGYRVRPRALRAIVAASPGTP
jgi:diacylglycerol kinase family enzyme